MSHVVVKFSTDDGGEKVIKDDWHLVINSAGSSSKLCTLEVFGFGESGSVYKEKEVDRGGITCKNCLREINFFKSIKL